MEIPKVNEKVEKPTNLQGWQNDQLIQTHRKIIGRNSPLDPQFLLLLESISKIGTNIFIVVILIKKKSLKPT